MKISKIYYETVLHMYASVNLAINVPDNGLSLVQRQAIFRTIGGIWDLDLLWKKNGNIWIKIQH